MATYIVYLTTNNKCSVNGNCKIYVGVHKITKRDKTNTYLGCGVWSKTPSTYSHPKSPFQKAVLDYGPEAFTRTILYTFTSEQEAYNKERESVNSEFIKKDYVYNVALGGDYEKRFKPLYQFDFKGTLVKKWDSSEAAYEFYKKSREDFDSCKRNKVSFIGYYWSTSSHIDVTQYKNISDNSVYLYSKDGTFIKSFFTQIECAKYLNYDSGELSRAIKNHKLVKKAYFVSKTSLNKEDFSKSYNKKDYKTLNFLYTKRGRV